MTPAFVLMYHRICQRNRESAPWFARGTAVSPEAFARQVEWLVTRFDVRDVPGVLDSPSRPTVAITFDDGYADVLHHALPVCEKFGIVGTTFVSSGPLRTGLPLWFDAFYAAAAAPEANAEGWFARHGHSRPRTPVEWANGPAKSWLGGRGRERAALVAELAQLCPERIVSYMSVADLRQILMRGWTIGGHGAEHHRLTELDDRHIARELEESAALLDSVGARPRVFAYPDGANDERVAGFVKRAGFEIACTVQPGSVEPGADRFQVPRLFARGEDHVPHPMLRAWC